MSDRRKASERGKEKMSRNIRKTTALALVLILVFSALPLQAAASEWSDNPVILLPGYSSSALVKVNEDASTEQVWGVDTDAILQAALSRIAELALGLGLAASGSDPAYLAQIVGEESYAILDGVRCQPDGSSVYAVRTMYSEPENTNNAYYLSHPDESWAMYESDIMGELGQIVDPSMLFNFNVDFRMGAIDCAEQLHLYIQKVLAYTGKDQVNLLAISHGGQVAGTYLSLHGTEGLIDHALLIVPALGGAGLAYDFLNRDIDFDEQTLVKFIEHGFMSETDYHWLVRAEATGFLDEVIDELIPYFLDSVLYWGSIWDFIPVEYYEELKARYLDEEESAELIAKSDRMHKEIMPNYAESFAACQAAGVKLNIMAGTDLPVVTGLQQNSDAIITTASSTGARCAPFGQRFADGYRGVGCGDGRHEHLSPAMTVDASEAYLPENTYFVEGLFHGMEYWDAHTFELLKKLLLTDELLDVHADPAFPQFHATTNPEQAVTAYFDRSPQGYVSESDSVLLVKNLSAQYPVWIVSVDVGGAALLIPGGKRIAPGETARLPVTGTVGDTARRKVQVCIHYCTSLEALTPVGERTLSFMTLGDRAAAFDPQHPYAPLDVLQSDFALVAGDRAASVLEKLGLLEFVEMFFDMIYTILKNIRLLFQLG